MNETNVNHNSLLSSSFQNDCTCTSEMLELNTTKISYYRPYYTNDKLSRKETLQTDLLQLKPISNLYDQTVIHVKTSDHNNVLLI